MADQFLRNPAYVEYVRQLIELHELVCQGGSDSERAEMLRDEMDSNWYSLSPDEMERVGIISADLDMLSGDEVFRPVPEEQREQSWFAPRFSNAVRQQRWDEALALLRSGPPYLFEGKPDLAAYFRARCYGELGHHQLARLFLDHAAMLAPDNSNYTVLALNSQVESGDLNGAYERAEEIVRNPDADAKLLFGAANVFYRSTYQQPVDQARPVYKRVIEVVERGLSKILDVPVNERSQLAGAAYTTLGVCREHLGQAEAALRAYEGALSEDPENIVAYIARAALRHDGTAGVSLRQLLAADDFWRLPLLSHPAIIREAESIPIALPTAA